MRTSSLSQAVAACPRPSFPLRKKMGKASRPQFRGYFSRISTLDEDSLPALPAEALNDSTQRGYTAILNENVGHLGIYAQLKKLLLAWFSTYIYAFTEAKLEKSRSLFDSSGFSCCCVRGSCAHLLRTPTQMPLNAPRCRIIRKEIQDLERPPNRRCTLLHVADRIFDVPLAFVRTEVS